MKKIIITITILLIVSVGFNIYSILKIQEFKKNDDKQLVVFSEVSDSLNVYRSKYRSDWQR